MGHDHGRDEIGRLSKRYAAKIKASTGFEGEIAIFPGTDARDAARLLKPGSATVHSGRSVLLPISPTGQRDAPRMHPGAECHSVAQVSGKASVCASCSRTPGYAASAGMTKTNSERIRPLLRSAQGRGAGRTPRVTRARAEILERRADVVLR